MKKLYDKVLIGAIIVALGVIAGSAINESIFYSGVPFLPVVGGLVAIPMTSAVKKGIINMFTSKKTKEKNNKHKAKKKENKLLFNGLTKVVDLFKRISKKEEKDKYETISELLAKSRKKMEKEMIKNNQAWKDVYSKETLMDEFSEFELSNIETIDTTSYGNKQYKIVDQIFNGKNDCQVKLSLTVYYMIPRLTFTNNSFVQENFESAVNEGLTKIIAEYDDQIFSEDEVVEALNIWLSYRADKYKIDFNEVVIDRLILVNYANEIANKQEENTNLQEAKELPLVEEEKSKPYIGGFDEEALKSFYETVTLALNEEVVPQIKDQEIIEAECKVIEEETVPVKKAKSTKQLKVRVASKAYVEPVVNEEIKPEVVAVEEIKENNTQTTKTKLELIEEELASLMVTKEKLEAAKIAEEARIAALPKKVKVTKVKK